MRTFDELLDDLEHRARWVPDEADSAKKALRSMLAAEVAAERERCARVAIDEDVAHTDDPIGVRECIADSILRA
jgi:hypothetical protein